MRAEPPLSSARSLNIGLMGIADASDRIHRFLEDLSTKTYFGYDVMATPTDSNQFLVTILPLQLPPADLPGRTPGPQPRIPGPQILQVGDTMAIDMLVSADGKQKVVDYIQVEPMRPKWTFTEIPPPPSLRDYTIDDGPLKFPVTGGAEIFINGQRQSSAGLTGKSGSTMWFYFPGQSRYVLSLEARNGYGFQAAGMIVNETIQFHADGNQYQIRFPWALISGRGAYRLYVLRDPDYRPPQGSERMILGGIDRLENLVKR
jgi:hypothetical protein